MRRVSVTSYLSTPSDCPTLLGFATPVSVLGVLCELWLCQSNQRPVDTKFRNVLLTITAHFREASFFNLHTFLFFCMFLFFNSHLTTDFHTSQVIGRVTSHVISTLLFQFYSLLFFSIPHFPVFTLHTSTKRLRSDITT